LTDLSHSLKITIVFQRRKNSMAFVHLHNHTQFSLLDGACRIDKMMQLAESMKMNAVAITDHGNMFGIIDFYNTAKKHKIKPIIGIEAYLINGDIDKIESRQERRYHLILLAQNLQGYKNLIKLSSKSFLDGFYYKPRISKALLEEYNEGLICLSACLQGEIPSLLLNDNPKGALEALKFYKRVFPGRFYVEVQDHDLPDEKLVMPKLIQLARETDTPMVVTNDCHYLKQEDNEAHDILLCIQTGKNLTDTNRMHYPTNQLYFKTEEEMRRLFPGLQDAYDNTQVIADQIDLQLDYNEFLLPRFDLPKGESDYTAYLRKLCMDGVPKRYGELTDTVLERIDYELGVIQGTGFERYFLVVKDFIDTARTMGIPVGPGRGSAAGSIVSYLLDITRLDPLKYDLLFERFLNPDRISMPDIDIDFCAQGRSRVIDYVIEKYGRNSVAQIITFGTLGAKSVIKDVARVMGVSAIDSNKITKLMSGKPKITLKECLKESPEFSNLMDNNELYATILKHSFVLEGLVRQVSVHAAGVLIGPGDLSDYVPLASTTQKGQETSALTQFEGKYLEELKLLKIDFLGLKTLSLIQRTIEIVKASQGIEIDIENLDLTDTKSYELLAHGQTDGIFQFESSGMKKNLMDLKPNQFEDLIAMVALYRPGPMQFISNYIRRKHGTEEVVYAHPLTEAALKETYGVIVYQEQVMQISREIANFTRGEADSLRKAMSKKKLKLMEEYEKAFKENAQKNGVSLQIADRIWDEMKKFAEYAFNKSHAACYALVAFQTAYLKSHYPVEFMAALLSLEDDPVKIPYFMEECSKMGIKVIPPDINQSHDIFAVQGDSILFGLRGIKNIGESAIEALIEERDKNGLYKNIYDLCTRVDPMAVNKTVLESLIAAGAMDSLEGDRSQKWVAVESIIEFAANHHREKKRGQITLFEMLDDSQVENTYYPQLPDEQEWSFTKKLEMEKSVLGFYVSGHPLFEYKAILDLFTNANSQTCPEQEKIQSDLRLVGIVTEIRKKKGKNGKFMAFVTCEDMEGRFELTLFDKDYHQYIDKIEKGSFIFIFGRKSSYTNGDETILRVVPKTLFPISDLKHHISGEVIIQMEEKEATADLANEVRSMSEDTNGQFNVSFVIKSDRFKQMVLHSNSLKIYPDSKLINNLQGRGLKVFVKTINYV
jgi:DNA polymerase III subunit alpha